MLSSILGEGLPTVTQPGADGVRTTYHSFLSGRESVGTAGECMGGYAWVCVGSECVVCVCVGGIPMYVVVYVVWVGMEGYC